MELANIPALAQAFYEGLPSWREAASPLGSVFKYLSDWVKLRRDAKGSAEQKEFRKFVEERLKEDQLEQAAFQSLQLETLERLATMLIDFTDDQATTVLTAIQDGNFDLLTGFAGVSAELNAKLDRILCALNVPPRNLFQSDYATWHEQQSRAFEERYLKRVRDKFGRLEMLGVPEAQDVAQELEVAYVTLDLSMPDGGGTGSRRAEDALAAARGLVIRGPAGSGKSTLMSWIAFRCAADFLDRQSGKKQSGPWCGGVPLYVPLRTLSGSENGKPDVSKLTDYAFGDACADPAPTGWIRKVLEEGRGVLLLDGVDELSKGARKSFWDWLRELVRLYPRVRVYVTSRRFGSGDDEPALDWSPPPHFNDAEIRDLTPEGVTVFVRKWYEGMKSSNRHRVSALDASRDALLKRLADRANDHVRAICKSPLIAALICALYWRKLQLPNTRYELYELSCDMLVDLRDEFRGIKTNTEFDAVPKSDKLLLLKCLAWEMQQNARTDTGYTTEVLDADARAWLRNHLARCKSDALLHIVTDGSSEENINAALGRLLEFLLERSGILRQPSKGLVDFHHRSFQEYLAACAAAILHQSGNLLKHATEDQWRDTIILAANTRDGGVGFGEGVVSGLLERAKREAHLTKRSLTVLAAAASAEMTAASPDLRSAVNAALETVVPPKSPEEADALAVGKETVLPYLKYATHQKKLKGTKVARACVRALAKIGTDLALAMLTDPDGYGALHDPSVWQEALECPQFEPTRVSAVWSMLIRRVLPDDIARRITTLVGFHDYTDLETLDLQGTSVTDAGLGALAGFANLKTLSLLGTNVTGAGLGALAGLHNLETLDLGRTKVTDAGLGALAGLSNLISLSLRDTNVTDTGLGALTGLPNLKRLIVGGTKVTGVGMSKFRATHPKCEFYK